MEAHNKMYLCNKLHVWYAVANHSQCHASRVLETITYIVSTAFVPNIYSHLVYE